MHDGLLLKVDQLFQKLKQIILNLKLETGLESTGATFFGTLDP